jgi:hypothetical protein
LESQLLKVLKSMLLSVLAGSLKNLVSLFLQGLETDDLRVSFVLLGVLALLSGSIGLFFLLFLSSMHCLRCVSA